MILLLVLAVGWFLQTSTSYAKIEAGSKPNAHLLKTTANTTNRTLVNIGQVSSWIYADGISANEPHGNSGFYYPRGSTPKTACIFQDGLIVGGYVQDGIDPMLRVGGQAYSAGTIQGAIISKGVAENPNDAQKVNRIWRVRRDFATVSNDGLRLDAAEFNDVNVADVTDGQIQELRDIYRQDWIDWPTYKGAPFYDADGDGVYTPQFNEDGTPKLYPEADEPGYAGGDQVVFLVCNDLDGSRTATFYGSPPIGFELQVVLWAYQRTDGLGNCIFKQFRLIYKGRAETPSNAYIDSCYFCQWSDPDEGEAGDDLAGCDTTLSLGYVYNGSSNDPVYSQAGYPPPAAGYDFFAGPRVKKAGGKAIFGLKEIDGYVNLPMTSFAFFAAGTQDSDPDRGGPYTGTQQWWNLLRGYRPRPISPPERWKDPQGNPTMFRVPGDPVTGTGWVDEGPADRRILLVSGPFVLAYGDTNETVVAALGGMGSDRLSSISVLKFYDRFAQNAFDVLFELPSAPPSPTMKATEFDGKILLNWGFDPVAVAKLEGFESKGYKFEGYNVYQLPNAGATPAQSIKLATYDVVNEVTTIIQETFDATSGQVLKLPVQVGKNTGLKRTFIVDYDKFRNLPLANGRTYYFGVTAYSYTEDEMATTKTLESTIAVATVVPQKLKPGYRMGDKESAMLEVTHTGPSDGKVEVTVVDPLSLTGHEYKVTFGTDAEGHDIWNLTDVTINKVLLANQTNQSGDDDYLIVDGMLVKVIGPEPGIKHDDMYSTDDQSKWGWNWVAGTRRLTWAGGANGFEFEGFRGALGWAQPDAFWGSGYLYPPYLLKPVLLKLAKVSGDGVFDPNDENVSYGYRYLRGAGNPPAKPEFAPYIVNPSGSYSYQDYTKSVPLSAWDISDPAKPRRLRLGYLENNVAGGMVDGKYWPPFYNDADNVAASGPREWLWIFDLDYGETPEPAQMVNVISPQPIMYWATWANRATSGWSPGGTGQDQMAIYPNLPNSVLDTFTFKSTAPSYSDADAKDDVKKINVFPNPYYGFNIVEKNQFNRFVTFSHLPPKATVRIFNLAGLQIRALEKNDPSQFMTWDLQNEEGLPVASGIYIIYIDMPDLKTTKTLKLAVIREQQFLPLY